MKGIKRYIITEIDNKSKFKFAYAYSNLSSKCGLDFIKKLRYASPYNITHIQTDNGSKFHKHYRDYFEKKKINSIRELPKRPKDNAFIERFNRTLKEEFIYQNYDDLIFDIEEFNRKMMEYLKFYNTKKPYYSIRYKSPIQYMIEDFKFSNMLWTYTGY